MAWASAGQCEAKAKRDRADFTRDGVVNSLDLAVFSSRYLELNWQELDWCWFHDQAVRRKPAYDKPTKNLIKHYGSLFEFMYAHFECGVEPEPEPDPIALENSPRFPTRVAMGPALPGLQFVTDPKVGSVFIYDVSRVLAGELKGLDKPLGIAVDTLGYLLIGNDGRDNVEVYDPEEGLLVQSFGGDVVQMPSSITIRADGYIYVTDSTADTIWVFDTSYNLTGNIGSTGSLVGQLRFPTDAQFIGNELFVADQVNMRIQVFDLQGNYLRSINKGPCTRIACEPPIFQRLQALSMDTDGALHALDMFEATVTMFEPASGIMLGTYGSYGESDGFLQLPIDLLVTSTGEAIVTDGGARRVQVLTVP